jgi:uncharacterized DUF497 family protein
MTYEFRWNEWNLEHIAEHGISPEEAQEIVRAARRPYPRLEGKRQYRVRGQTSDGHYLQVIYLIGFDKLIFVIHARPLKENEKRQLLRGSS